MDYLLELLSPRFWVWTAAISFAGSLIACAQIARNELKRAARREFRRALSRRHFLKADEMESLLARSMVTAMKERHFEPIRDIGMDRLLEDYILDIDFKRRLFDKLSYELNSATAATSKDSISGALEAVESWRHRPVNLPKELSNYFSNYARSDLTARWAMKYLESRDNYFEEKRKEMVEDVSAAVLAAVALRAPVSTGAH